MLHRFNKIKTHQTQRSSLPNFFFRQQFTAQTLQEFMRQSIRAHKHLLPATRFKFLKPRAHLLGIALPTTSCSPFKRIRHIVRNQPIRFTRQPGKLVPRPSQHRHHTLTLRNNRFPNLQLLYCTQHHAGITCSRQLPGTPNKTPPGQYRWLRPRPSVPHQPRAIELRLNKPRRALTRRNHPATRSSHASVVGTRPRRSGLLFLLKLLLRHSTLSLL